MRVVQIEYRRGEGLKSFGWGGREVEDAAVGQVDGAGGGLEAVGLLAGVFGDALEGEGCSWGRDVEALFAREGREARGGVEHDPAAGAELF